MYIQINLLFLLLLINFSASARSGEHLHGPFIQVVDEGRLVFKWAVNESSKQSKNEEYLLKLRHPQTNAYQVYIAKREDRWYQVEVANLPSGIRYEYQLEKNGIKIFHAYFNIPPRDGILTPFRVVLTPDAVLARDDSKRLFRDYIRNFSHPHTNYWLILNNLGFETVRAFDRDMAHLSSFRALLPNAFLGEVSLADPGETLCYLGCLTKRSESKEASKVAYYSYDFANMHVVVLDILQQKSSTLSAMQRWLERDLQSYTAEWLIALWRYPPYAHGDYDSDVEKTSIIVREQLLPLLESYGVDVVITGSAYAYQRSIFIDSHHGIASSFNSPIHAKDLSSGRQDVRAYIKPSSSVANSGAVYVGLGGDTKRNTRHKTHPANYIVVDEPGLAVLEVQGKTLYFEYVAGHGKRIDYFTIDKTGASNAKRTCTWHNGSVWPICKVDVGKWSWEGNRSCISESLCSRIHQVVEKCHWYDGKVWPICERDVGGWSWENNRSCVAKSICPKIEILDNYFDF